MKVAGPFKNIVKFGTRTKGRFQAMKMRFRRSLENKTLLCEYADRKTKIIKKAQAVKKRICKRVEKKKRQIKLSAYINNGNMTGGSCQKGWGEPFSTHHHTRERERERS